MILGTGKSREQMRALEDMFLCMGAPLSWEIITENIEKEEEFDNMILAVRRNGLAIKGNILLVIVIMIIIIFTFIFIKTFL